MINILHIINGWPAGGIAEQTYLLTKYLPKDKFKQYSIGYCHFDGYFVSKFEEQGVPCLKSNRYYSNLMQVLDHLDIDIVHKQTGGGDYPFYADRLTKAGIPLVESLHCPRTGAIPPDKVSRLVYTTQYTYEKNKNKYRDKLVQIPYALDLEAPIREEPEIRDVPLKVGRLGRIVPDKRPEILIDLARMALEDNLPIEFHIAGMIPTDYKFHIKFGDQMKDLMHKAPNITYHGFVDDKYDFWKTLDICINPVWETSFDIVFLEAMACGIPILTWEDSAAPYVVQDAGIITEATVEDMYEGLKSMIYAKEHRRLMGKKGIEYISSQYNIEQLIGKYIKMYEEVHEEATSA